jgi:hypothetical protein
VGVAPGGVGVGVGVGPIVLLLTLPHPASMMMAANKIVVDRKSLM